jgi:hypothetical protein
MGVGEEKRFDDKKSSQSPKAMILGNIKDEMPKDKKMGCYLLNSYQSFGKHIFFPTSINSTRNY